MIGVAVAGEGHIGPGHVRLQLFPHPGLPADGHPEGIVEGIGDIRAVPGGLAPVVGEGVGKEVIPGLCPAVLRVVGAVFQGAQAVGQAKQLRFVLIRPGGAEGGDQLVRFLLPELLCHDGALLSLAHPVPPGDAGAEAPFRDDAAHHDGDILRPIQEAHVVGVSQIPVVGGGGPPAHDALGLKAGAHGAIGHAQLFEGHGLQGGNVRLPQLLQQGFHQGLFAGFGGGGPPAAHAAHEDALVEKALGRRGVQHGVDLSAAAGLAEDGHIVRVAAESGDVLMDPAQGFHQVGLAQVAAVGILPAVFAQVEIAQDVQPVVHRHHHHVPELGELVAVVGHHLHGAAGGIAAAVEPDHNGLFGVFIQALGPEVEAQAVLALGPEAVGDHHVAPGILVVQQRADRPRGVGIDHALPGFHGLGHHKALRPGVGHAQEIEGASHLIAPEFACPGFRDGPVLPADEGLLLVAAAHGFALLSVLFIHVVLYHSFSPGATVLSGSGGDFSRRPVFVIFNKSGPLEHHLLTLVTTCRMIHPLRR